MAADLETRLRLARPADGEPTAEATARALRAFSRRRRGRGRSAVAWVTRTPRGRLLGVAVLLAAGGTGVAATLLPGGGGRATPVSRGAITAEWGPAFAVAPVFPRGQIPKPVAGMDPSGAVLVAWSRGRRIEVRRRPPDGPWGPTTRLSGIGVGTARPEVAFADGGRAAVVVWRERMGGRVIRRVLRLPDGSVAGVIQRRVGTRYVVVARRWSATGGWGPRVQVSPDSSGNRRDMSDLAVLGRPNGAFLIAWPHAGRIQTRTLRADGGLGDPQEVTPPRAGEVSEPVLADRGGTPLVVFAHRERPVWSHDGAVMASAADGPGWEPPVRLGTGLALNERPVVAARGSRILVAWTSRSTGTPMGIVVSEHAGGTWSPQVRISSPRREAYSPGAGFDRAGTAVASWSVGAATQVSTRAPGGAWTAPAGVSRAGLTGAYSPEANPVASTGDGDLVLALGTRGGLRVADWRGGRLGGPVTAAGSTGWQFGYSGIAAAPTGSAALLMTTFSEDGAGISVTIREPAGLGRDKEAG
ncbi:MAG: hypothetical protein IT200_10655 [Thermoleophilia bacterium]|nr:hypothetical protein [Thermoleophilia bacterium]